MYMLVALLAFLDGFGGKSAKNVECTKGKRTNYIYEKNFKIIKKDYIFERYQDFNAILHVVCIIQPL